MKQTNFGHPYALETHLKTGGSRRCSRRLMIVCCSSRLRASEIVHSILTTFPMGLPWAQLCLACCLSEDLDYRSLRHTPVGGDNC